MKLSRALQMTGYLESTSIPEQLFMLLCQPAAYSQDGMDRPLASVCWYLFYMLAPNLQKLGGTGVCELCMAQACVVGLLCACVFALYGAAAS